jgi:hypothetical protein
MHIIHDMSERAILTEEDGLGACVFHEISPAGVG